MKTFADFGIDIRGATSGNIKIPCPECSSSRKKKNDPCLSVNVDEEIWNCHHCEWTGSLKNNSPMNKIVSTYDYQDQSGTLLFQTVRFSPKTFRQRRPDGNGDWKWDLDGVRRVLYRLPEFIKSNGAVYIPGGEKDVDTLVKHGLTATTNPCGEGNWRSEFNEYLKDRDVVILEDNDEKGQKHGRMISKSLLGIAKTIKIIKFPHLQKGGDVTDFLMDHSIEELTKRVENAPLHKQDAEKGKIIQFPVPPKDAGIESLMKYAGVSALTENSNPDEIIKAIIEFSKIIVEEDPVWLGVAKSELVKKLKSIKVQSPSKLINEALKPSKPESAEGQGKAFTFEDPEPWSDEVDGANLLDEISEIVRRYMILPEGADIALSLWALFAWVHDAFPISPLLDFSSPMKRCGKSTGLKVLRRLVPKPLSAANVSTAVLFRAIEAFNPTLLIDEVDTFLNRDPETNGILNAGHEREGAHVLRNEGDKHEPRQFSVWCPKVLSGIGRRKDTLVDRSISIPMKRKGPGEKVEKIPIRGTSEFLDLCRKMVRWSQDNLEELKSSNPDIQESLNDRAQDNWFPLLAIAELCGGDWPLQAREAALILSSDDNQEDDNISIQLLEDIRKYFELNEERRVSSEDLVKYLVTLEDRPWPELGKTGRPITKTGVARILKRFDIKPRQLRIEGKKERGYIYADFEDAWTRYLSGTDGTLLKSEEVFMNTSGAELPMGTEDILSNPFKNSSVPLVPDEKKGREDNKGDGFVEEYHI